MMKGSPLVEMRKIALEYVRKKFLLRNPFRSLPGKRLNRRVRISSAFLMLCNEMSGLAMLPPLNGQDFFRRYFANVKPLDKRVFQLFD